MMPNDDIALVQWNARMQSAGLASHVPSPSRVKALVELQAAKRALARVKRWVKDRRNRRTQPHVS